MIHRFKLITLRFVLYALLFGGAIIVLLPMMWMVITACKQRGQALQFQFLPSSTLEGPQKNLLPLDGSGQITFEYDPSLHPDLPAPSEVTVAGEFNGWNKSRDYLICDGGVWTTTLAGLKPGNYSYKFVINGQKWTEDKSNPKKNSEGNSVIEIKSGWNSNKVLSDASQIVDKKVVFKIRRSGCESLSVKVNRHADPIPLVKKGDFFEGELSLSSPETVEYRVIEPQSFWEGMAKIYTLENFSKVLKNRDFPFARFFINSLIVAAGTALITVFLCTLAGYVFAKKSFFLKDKIFMILMSTMMIPGMIFMVPQFAIVNRLGWINTYQGMMIPHLANIFGLFLLRQYISTIPHSLFEAAYIDGASEWQIFKIIILPLSFPIMVTLFLMTFVSQWGNFLWQLIVNTPDSPYRTLPVGLALFKGQYGQDWELMMAGACFSILPIAVLFLMAQRFFIEGMTSGSVKE